jgi:hypothetical protein
MVVLEQILNNSLVEILLFRLEYSSMFHFWIELALYCYYLPYHITFWNICCSGVWAQNIKENMGNNFITSDHFKKLRHRADKTVILVLHCGYINQSKFL